VSKTDIWLVILGLLLLIIVVLLPILGAQASKTATLKAQVTQLKAQAIQYGAAYYHQKTAEFTWKEKENAEGN
jgi:cytochrome oxidase Cu insertion factor (SCO1/SenC/PrrC family)